MGRSRLFEKKNCVVAFHFEKFRREVQVLFPRGFEHTNELKKSCIVLIERLWVRLDLANTGNATSSASASSTGTIESYEKI